MVDNELIMNVYSNLCPTLLICSDLIRVRYIVKVLIAVIPLYGFKMFSRSKFCDLPHEYKGR